MEPQVKKSHYFRRKYDDLNRFISYFYQVDLVQELAQRDANIRMHANDTNNTNFKILEIGKGNSFFADYLKKLKYDVTTCDFDKNLSPDIVADIRSLPIQDTAFDLVTAFEVLEHIPYEDLPKALKELRRVSKKYVIVSLPYRSAGLEWVLKFPGIRTLIGKPFLSIFLRLPLWFGGIQVSKQHYWEIDLWNYSLRKIRKMLKNSFKIKKEIRPVLNHCHYFFVLEK